LLALQFAKRGYALPFDLEPADFIVYGVHVLPKSREHELTMLLLRRKRRLKGRLYKRHLGGMVSRSSDCHLSRPDCRDCNSVVLDADAVGAWPVGVSQMCY
jgi:hypothetical protein